jgi:hypothetical protein
METQGRLHLLEGGLAFSRFGRRRIFHEVGVDLPWLVVVLVFDFGIFIFNLELIMLETDNAVVPLHLLLHQFFESLI